MLVSLPIYANQIGKSLDNRSISAHIVLPQQLRRVLKSLKAFLELGQHLLIWHSGRVLLLMGVIILKNLICLCSDTVQWCSELPKGGFFSENAIRFLHLQISKKNYSEKLS